MIFKILTNTYQKGRKQIFQLWKRAGDNEVLGYSGDPPSLPPSRPARDRLLRISQLLFFSSTPHQVTTSLKVKTCGFPPHFPIGRTKLDTKLRPISWKKVENLAWNATFSEDSESQYFPSSIPILPLKSKCWPKTCFELVSIWGKRVKLRLSDLPRRYLPPHYSGYSTHKTLRFPLALSFLLFQKFFSTYFIIIASALVVIVVVFRGFIDKIKIC